MGRHKLLLELAGRTVLARLIAALSDSGVESIQILVREDDWLLRRECETLPVDVRLVAGETHDMRTSVQHLLDDLDARFAPSPRDAWLLCPADHPVLNAATVTSVLAASRVHPGSICLPAYGGRRGHPALFPWPLAAAVRQLPSHQGVNQLLRMPGALVTEVPVEDESILFDLDTPADFAALERRVAAEANPGGP